MLRVVPLASLVIIALAHPETTFAQSQSLQSVMTGAGELLIGLDISYLEDKENTAIFTTTFYHPNATDVPEEHIDYNFLILKEGNIILNAGLTDDSPMGIIHTIEAQRSTAFHLTMLAHILLVSLSMA